MEQRFPSNSDELKWCVQTSKRLRIPRNNVFKTIKNVSKTIKKFVRMDIIKRKEEGVYVP